MIESIHLLYVMTIKEYSKGYTEQSTKEVKIKQIKHAIEWKVFSSSCSLPEKFIFSYPKILQYLFPLLPSSDLFSLLQM